MKISFEWIENIFHFENNTAFSRYKDVYFILITFQSLMERRRRAHSPAAARGADVMFLCSAVKVEGSRIGATITSRRDTANPIRTKFPSNFNYH